MIPVRPRLETEPTVLVPPGAHDALVCVVVLNWNKAQQSADCVRSLQRQSHRNLRVIVVDNGSCPRSLTPLETLDTPFILLRNERNCGFTGGVNVGIRRALIERADYIWLLNNDAVPDPDVLSSLLSVIEADPGVGLASPLIRNADAKDEIEFCGGLWKDNLFQTTADPAVYRAWREQAPECIWLVGTALLIRRSLVEMIGVFDDQFFAYWEDNDYSVRSIRAGFRNVVVPDVVVRHWSGTPKTDPAMKPLHYHYYMARNEILFFRKHVTPRKAVKLLLWAVRRQLRQIDRLRSCPATVDAVLGGLWDGLLGRGGAYVPRRRFSPATAGRLINAGWIVGHRS